MSSKPRSKKAQKLPYDEWKQLSPTQKKALKAKLVAQGAMPAKKPYSKKTKPASSSKKMTKYVKKEVDKESMTSFPGRASSICTDAFRIGEYSIDAKSVDVQQNYYAPFLELQINPKVIVETYNNANKDRKLVEGAIKLSGFVHAYQRFQFKKLSFAITNTLPQTVSGTIMAMMVPDPEAEITPTNVLSVFESIRGQNGKDQYNAVIIPPGKTKYINIPATGVMYVDYDTGGTKVNHEPRIYAPGKIVIAPMTEILSATAANSGGSTVTRQWVGQIAVVKCELSCHFYDKCYIPVSISNPLSADPGQKRDFTEAESTPTIAPVAGTVTNVIAPSLGVAMQVGLADKPTPSTITPGVDHEAIANRAPLIASSSNSTGHKDPLAPGQVMSGTFSLRVNNNLQPLNELFELSWSGLFDYIASSVGPIIKGTAQLFFGDYFGGCIYDFAKEIYTTLKEVILQPPNPAGGPISGSSLIWDNLGVPRNPANGSVNVGIIQPGSVYYQKALEAFRSNLPEVYSLVQRFIQDGWFPDLLAIPQGSMSGTGFGGPYLGQSAVVDYNMALGQNGLEYVSAGLSQPLAQSVDIGQLEGMSTDNLNRRWVSTLPNRNQMPLVDPLPGFIRFYFYHDSNGAGAGDAAVYIAEFTDVTNDDSITASMFPFFNIFIQENCAGFATFGNGMTSVKLVGHLGLLDAALPPPVPVLGVWPDLVLTTNSYPYPVDRFPVDLDVECTPVAAIGYIPPKITFHKVVSTLTANTLAKFAVGGCVPNAVGGAASYTGAFAVPDRWYSFEGRVKICK